MSSVARSCQISVSLWRAIQERCRASGESVDHLVRAALADYLQVDHGTLFQVSTAGALVEGLYRGEVTIRALREHGDFGLGTFDGLDGEMVALDGRFYQVRGDGTVREVEDDARTPYAMITRSPAGVAVKLSDCADLSSLHAQLDQLRESQNVFYAVRIDGEFDRVITRSVKRTPEGVPLIAAASQQRQFHLQNVRGTLVGFWSPGYLQQSWLPAFTCIFFRMTGRFGGHLLDCTGRSLQAWVRRETDFRVSLPESPSFLRADLTRDPAQDLD